MGLEFAAEFAGVPRPRTGLAPRRGFFRNGDRRPVHRNGVGKPSPRAPGRRGFDDHRLDWFVSSGRGRNGWRRGNGVSGGGRTLRRRRVRRPQS